MTNFHDLKTRDLSPKENEVAVGVLAAWLYLYSATFDYDNVTVADARIAAASILAEAKELCEDEGCPQAGTVHVCVSKGEPVPNKDENGNPSRREFVSPEQAAEVNRKFLKKDKK